MDFEFSTEEFFCLFFSYRSSSALHCRSSAETLGSHSVQGVPQCLFFVSGSGGIRNHVLVHSMRTLYRYPILTTQNDFFPLKPIIKDPIV